MDTDAGTASITVASASVADEIVLVGTATESGTVEFSGDNVADGKLTIPSGATSGARYTVTVTVKNTDGTTATTITLTITVTTIA